MSTQTRVVRCKRCGASASLVGTKEPELCAHCGAPLPRPREETKPRRGHPNPTPLKPGMTAQWRGEEYTLTGRVVFRVTEEDETSYWHEFELISADGHCMFLEYDEGNWKLMEAFVPTQPIGPEQALHLKAGATVNLDGQGARVTEVNKATVHAAEGELTYAPEVGWTVHYVDARGLNCFYAVEWSGESLEFYRGRPLSEREVLSLFGLKERLAELDRRLAQRQVRVVFACVCLACSVIGFFAGAGAQSSGRVISQGSHPLMSVGADGVRFPVGSLDPRHHIHRLVIYGSMREASAWVSGILEAADGTEVLGTQRDFWDESGYDEGYWHESDLRAQTDFVVRESRPYSMRLYVERDSSRGSYGDAGYELRAGVIYPSYYFSYGTVTLLIAIVMFLTVAKKPSTMSA